MTPRPEEKKSSAPGWIVTFSDMITLLLTFFVLLLSMAETQVDDHKFREGQASFMKAVADFGVAGFLINRSTGPQLEHPKPKYRVDEGQDKREDRSIDSHTEMMRRVLMEIESMMKISPSHITGMDKNFIQTGVLFPAGQSALSPDAQRRLAALADQINITYARQEPTIYVLGLAANERTEAAQWTVSARRAMGAADCVRSHLSDKRWPVFSWGAGAGGDWIGHAGQVTPRTHLLIVVLTEKNR